MLLLLLLLFLLLMVVLLLLRVRLRWRSFSPDNELTEAATFAVTTVFVVTIAVTSIISSYLFTGDGELESQLADIFLEDQFDVKRATFRFLRLGTLRQWKQKK